MAEDATVELDGEEEDHFTQVPNTLIRDKTLTTDARWAASFVMSHARGYRVTIGTIRASAGHWGKDRTYNAVAELIRAGYCRREEEREAGRFVRFRYIVRKRPFPAPPDAVPPDAAEPPHKNTSNPRTPDGVEGEPSPSGDEATHRLQITDGMRRLCELMADHVEQMTSKRPPITQDWLIACRRLITRDGATEEQIEYVIRWVGQDDFWDSNILSMPTLRRQWDKLVARIMSERRRASRPRRRTLNGGTDVTFADLDAAIAYYEATEGTGDGSGPAGPHVADGPGRVAKDRQAVQGALPVPADPGRDD